MFRVFRLGGAVAMMFAAAAATAEPTAATSNPNVDPLRVETRTAPQITSSGSVGQFVQSEYWLGIECFPVMPALRSHLNLAEKEGLQVLAVVSGSPAAKAGIAQHDVLLRVGDRPLGELRDLIEAVDAARGGKLKIELIRGGKPRTIEATPEKRPPMAGGQVLAAPNSEDWDIVQKWLSGLRSEDLRLGAVGTGLLVPKGVPIPKSLPANLSIAISKVGDQPAKISVRRGNDKWELTEKDLDKLPADIRPHVERMLHPETGGIFGGLKAIEIVPNKVFQMPGQDARLRIPVPSGVQIQQVPTPGSLEEIIQRRMDEMDRRMEQLFRAVEALRAEHEGAKAPAPEKK